MRNPLKVSRREFVTLAAAGLSLASPKKFLAMSRQEVAGTPRHIALTKRCNSFSTTTGVS
jgi:hypothetical protein